MNRIRFLQLLGDWGRGEGPLYRRLHESIRGAIERGELRVGTRLPAQRSLARWLEVSRTTVVLAYEALASEGWLESRQGSGTTVRRAPASIATRDGASAALSTQNAVFRALISRSGAEFELVGAHLEGLPKIFEEVWKEAGRDLAQLAQGHGYVALGLPDLRAAIARHLEEQGLPTHADQVLVTCGAQQAIGLVASLILEPGDGVVVEDPTYPGAIDAFTSFGARVTGVPLGRRGLEVESLREAMARTAPRLVYVIPTCQNPTGVVLSESDRLDLMHTLEGSGAVVIEDLTLADLALESDVPPPLATFARDATVVTVGSLSKLFWGGLRVGWIRAPEPLIGRLARLKVVSDLSGSIPSQAVAIRVLARAQEIATLRRRQIRTRLAHASRLLADRLPGWTWREPQGGLSIWIRMPAGDASELATIALRHGVAIIPGTVCSPEDRWSDHLRLPFAATGDTMDAAIQRIASAWSEYAEYVPERPSRRAGVNVLV